MSKTNKLKDKKTRTNYKTTKKLAIFQCLIVFTVLTVFLKQIK